MQLQTDSAAAGDAHAASASARHLYARSNSEGVRAATEMGTQAQLDDGVETDAETDARIGASGPRLSFSFKLDASSTADDLSISKSSVRCAPPPLQPSTFES